MQSQCHILVWNGMIRSQIFMHSRRQWSWLLLCLWINSWVETHDKSVRIRRKTTLELRNYCWHFGNSHCLLRNDAVDFRSPLDVAAVANSLSKVPRLFVFRWILTLLWLPSLLTVAIHHWRTPLSHSHCVCPLTFSLAPILLLTTRVHRVVHRILGSIR